MRALRHHSAGSSRCRITGQSSAFRHCLYCSSCGNCIAHPGPNEIARPFASLGWHVLCALRGEAIHPKRISPGRVQCSRPRILSLGSMSYLSHPHPLRVVRSRAFWPRLGTKYRHLALGGDRFALFAIPATFLGHFAYWTGLINGILIIVGTVLILIHVFLGQKHTNAFVQSLTWPIVYLRHFGPA